MAVHFIPTTCCRVEGTNHFKCGLQTKASLSVCLSHMHSVAMIEATIMLSLPAYSHTPLTLCLEVSCIQVFVRRAVKREHQKSVGPAKVQFSAIMWMCF